MELICFIYKIKIKIGDQYLFIFPFKTTLNKNVTVQTIISHAIYELVDFSIFSNKTRGY